MEEDNQKPVLYVNIQAEVDLCQDITLNNCPQSLAEIELQIDRLKQRWGECTYLIGQRLEKIRTEKLFKEKGYNDFKSYIQSALKMSESNAYYYMAVFEYFSEYHAREIGSKLKLVIPVLNQIKNDNNLPQNIKKMQLDLIKNKIISKIQNKSYREAEKFIKNFKEKIFTKAKKYSEKKLLENNQENLPRIQYHENSFTILDDDYMRRDELINMIKSFYSKYSIKI